MLNRGVLIVFYLGIYLFGTSQADASKAFIDISSKKLNQNIFLDTEWKFYYGELLDSEAFDTISNTISVPSKWSENGYSNKGVATYQLKLRKSSNQQLGIVVPDAYSSCSLIVNGKVLYNKGVVSKDPSEFKPYRNVKLVPLLEFDEDTLSIVIQVANWVHTKGGIDHSIEIGDYKRLSYKLLVLTVGDMFLTGCLLMGFFFFLGLYFFGRQQELVVYFALFCFCYAYRIVGWGNYPLHDLVYMPYWLSIRLEYLTLYLSGYFFAHYVKLLFPEESPNLLVKIFEYASLVFAASVLLPVSAITTVNIVYLFTILGGILIISVIYVRAWINRRLGADYALISTFCMFVVVVLKSLDYIGVLEEPKIITLLAQVFFILFQSLILSNLFASGWRRAKERAERTSEDLQHAQNRLIESEKLASIGILTAGLAHELNNPLNIIGGVIDPVKKDLEELKEELDNQDHPLISEVFSLLDNIQDASAKASGVIRNLLDITPRNKEDFYEIFDLKELIYSSLSLIQKGNKEINFVVDIARPFYVYGNPVELNQVFLNLFKNSIDALKGKDNPEVSISVTQVERFLKIKFGDNGSGIRKEKLGMVFDPFFSEKQSENGTGLGLYISKSIILKHSGSINVKSEPGSGATFTITLPVAEANRPN